MKLKSLIMAGGRGTRLGMDAEKPMVRLSGAPMIDYVISALKGASMIDEIFVAVSPHTPATGRYLLKKGEVRVIRTAGTGYHEDLVEAFRSIGGFKCLVVSADLPALKADDVDFVAREYVARGKPSLAVASLAEDCRIRGFVPTSTFRLDGKELVPCGVNVIDGSMIGESCLEETVLIVNAPRFYANINTLADLELLNAAGGTDLRLGEQRGSA